MPYYLFCLFLVGSTGLGAQVALPDTAILLAPGLIDTPLNERDFTLAPDGSEAYFTRSHYDNRTRVIVRIPRVGEGWGEPEVASFSGTFNDLEPFFAPDGQRLYFASNRDSAQVVAPDRIVKAPPQDNYDIWYVERHGESWGSPVRLGPNVNTPADEFYPAVTADGTLYFTAERESGIGSEDIFRSEYRDGRYQPATVLPASVNSETYEFNAYVNPADDLILFSSYGRADDRGGGDLYYSIRNADGQWIPARSLGPQVNTTSLDYCPYYDGATATLYYTSNVADEPAGPFDLAALHRLVDAIRNGYGNIYRIPWSPDPARE